MTAKQDAYAVLCGATEDLRKVMHYIDAHGGCTGHEKELEGVYLDVKCAMLRLEEIVEEGRSL